MKIQLETYETKYSVETPNDDVSIEVYLDIFKGLLIQASFSESIINNAIIELAEEINQ